MLQVSLLVAGTLLFSACGVKKYLHDDQSLLVKNKVIIEKPYRKEIASNITKYYRQKPNRLFLGLLNTRPYFYFRGSTGKDNGIKRFERTVLGEPAVITDSVFMNNTVKSFEYYLRNMGYYYPDISYTVSVNKNKKARVTYYVKLNKQYVLGEYDLQVADKEIFKLVEANMGATLIKTGQGFHHDVLKQEQERVLGVLRNNGYYGVSSEFLDFDVDTNAPDGFVKLGLNIRNPNDSTLHKKYYIKSISVDIDKSTGPANNPGDTFRINHVRYNLGKYKLNPNVLDRNIQFATGELYTQQKLNRTYSRLSDLNIFRFINIQTKLRENKDSGFIHYEIKMVPSIKYTFSFEPQAITSDQNNTFSAQSFRNYGIVLLTQVTNKNIFRNAEILQLSFRSSFEAQGGGSGSQFFNATEQSITANIIMPRILWFPSYDKNLNFMSTRTIISTSAIYEVNIDYNRTVFTSSLNYQFNKKLFTFIFAPIEASFIRSEIRNDELKAQSENDIFLQNTFSNNLILNSRFGLIYNNKSIAKGLSFVNIRWDAIELAGNALTAANNLLGSQKNAEGSYELFGVQYYQYAKSAVDFRYTTVYDQNNITVIRLFSGVAVPYGNTPDYVPFERRFFIGGVNSLRAWRPRSIGPGSYQEENQLDYSGEVKLEANAEYRFNIYRKWLEGALFTDAGNVWAIKDDPARPGAAFRFRDFYKSLAWDAGVGIRFNFNIIVLRFDFALPIMDPSLTLEERRYEKSLSKQDWTLRNTNFNFGIGYPF